MTNIISEGIMEGAVTTRMQNHYFTDTDYWLTRIRGRVNIEASWRHGLLYVQLIRVAELVTHSLDQPYEIRAKISIEHTCTCKSEQQCNCHQVKMVRCSRFPVFNSKVSFEVTSLDCDMRLMVTILIYDSVGRRQTIIGSTSFSIKSIVVENKVISGWYFLYKEEDLHIVKNEISTSEKLKWELAAQSDNQFWLDPKCFISRVFFMPLPEVLNEVQFHSCRPPTVSEVVGASLLQSGDVIFSLNDIDVSSYTGSSIHHITRSVNTIFKVEVLREVPKCSARYEFYHSDKRSKREVYRKKRELAEYDFCYAEKQRGIGEETENAETIAVCMKEQKNNEEIVHEDLIKCVCDPDATKTAMCSFVSCGSRPKPSILKNITMCMGDETTLNSRAREQIYNRR